MKPKVLVVAINFFYPEALDGANKITYNLLKKNEYYDCSFLSLVNTDRNGLKIKDFDHVNKSSLGIDSKTLNFNKKLIPWALGLSPLISLPKGVLVKVARRIVEVEKNYDVIQLCHLGLGGCLNFLPEKVQEKTILLAVDSYNLYISRKKKQEQSLLKRIAYSWELFLSKRFEQKVYKLAKEVLYVSKVDKEYSNRIFPSSSIGYVNLGVDVDYFKKNSEISVKYNQLIFTGNFNYGPNQDAAFFLIREVLPCLLKKNPNITLVLAGANPTKELMECQAPNIVVTGFVQDLRESIWPSGLYLCPLRYGAGMKNKLLEAFAMEKITICSELSTQGIVCEDKKHCLIVKDGKLETWVDTILETLENLNSFKFLGENARRLVCENYSWDQMRKSYGEVYNKIKS